MFNAQMAQLDDKAATKPYLIESLPQLGTDSWQVTPDGRMVTTYKLRETRWHDGTAFTADDFAFSYRAYSTQALGHSSLAPIRFIEAVEAPDPRTVVIRWRQSYPDVAFVAGLNAEFPPLPGHILENSLQPDQPDLFINSPYWTREYVGVGPYQLARWEPGAFLEGVAYDGHLGGRAKIDRIKLSFIGDARTVLASVLAGETHLTDGSSASLIEMIVLKREWVSKGLGGIFNHPNQWRAIHFQHRPDYVSPAALLNPVMRRALAHSVDRQPLNDALYDGDGGAADSPFPPQSLWGPAVERGVAKYPYDPQRSEQLMRELGYAKGPDGFYANPTQGRFTFEVKTNAASDNESEIAILGSTWRQAGFDATEAILPAALAQNPEARATFPGVYTNSQQCCESAMLGLVSLAAPSAENRWAGGNRSGYSNPQYDRLTDTFTRALNPAERNTQMAELVRILTEDVQSITLFIRAQPWAYVSELKGLTLAPPEGNMAWDLQNWEFR
ncbi:MAG: hypothetical protein HW416_1388 [Chloroflexi bacterium]|nr:hypothetical protein [Chloroflexota bacterium]